MSDVWKCILQHERFQLQMGLRAELRREQALAAMRQIISAELEAAFRRDPRIQARLPQMEALVRSGRISAFAAARTLLSEFRNSVHPGNC